MTKITLYYIVSLSDVEASFFSFLSGQKWDRVRNGKITVFLHWNLKWSWQREPLVIVRTTRKIFKISVKEQKTREGKIGMKAQWQCHEDGHYYSEVWQSGTCQADILVGMLAASMTRHVAFHYWKQNPVKMVHLQSFRVGHFVTLLPCHACTLTNGVHKTIQFNVNKKIDPKIQ